MLDQAVLATAAKVREVITPLCADTNTYALLDFPAHPNVGDSAIWAGEQVLLDDVYGHRPDYVCALYDFSDRLNTVMPEGVIFLHGGGNFGDVWPAHQNFREAVLARYPDRKIVQLPQSVHFSNESAIDQCARAIAGHPDFTLLVRDQESYDLCSKRFDCQVTLCPDSAYMLSDLATRVGPITPQGTLCLFRTDHEARGDTDKLSAFQDIARIEDWLEEPPIKTPVHKAIDRIGRIGALEMPMMSQREASFRRMAWTRIDRGVAQLLSAEHVVTDRLHAHILSALLGIRHVVIDNSYRKIGRYIDAWPKDALTQQAMGYSEARQKLDTFREAG